jgi:hypothetical protein
MLFWKTLNKLTNFVLVLCGYEPLTADLAPGEATNCPADATPFAQSPTSETARWGTFPEDNGGSN